jgi:hypothetical protein
MARTGWGPKGVAGCARCGSGRVHPKLLVMGPVPGIDSDAYSYICEDCRYEGMPVIFDTDEQRAQFEKEIRERGRTPSEKPLRTAPSIPILPIYTKPLLDLPLFDQLPVRAAAVVGVRWDGRRLQPTGNQTSFQEYWNVIGGSRYNASLLYMLDLSGIERGNPNFDVMRHLVQRVDVWLDLGVRDSDDIMDGYMLDVERVERHLVVVLRLDLDERHVLEGEWVLVDVAHRVGDLEVVKRSPLEDNVFAPIKFLNYHSDDGRARTAARNDRTHIDCLRVEPQQQRVAVRQEQELVHICAVAVPATYAIHHRVRAVENAKSS